MPDRQGSIGVDSLTFHQKKDHQRNKKIAKVETKINQLKKFIQRYETNLIKQRNVLSLEFPETDANTILLLICMVGIAWTVLFIGRIFNVGAEKTLLDWNFYNLLFLF